MVDFKLFGSDDDNLGVFTEDGWISLHLIDLMKKQAKTVLEQKVELIQERKEVGHAIAICSNNRFICVETVKNNRPHLISSRYIVFEIQGKDLIWV